MELIGSKQNMNLGGPSYTVESKAHRLGRTGSYRDNRRKLIFTQCIYYVSSLSLKIT